MSNLQDVTGGWPSARETDFTAREVVSAFFKHYRVILFCFVAVTVLVAGGMLVLPPTYIAEGKILVKTEQEGNPSIFSGVAAYREQQESDPVNRKLETEMELIATRELSERVVRRLGLTYESVYRTPLSHFLRPFEDAYEWIKVRWFSYPEDRDAHGFKGTVKAFNSSFTVSPLKSKSAETTSNVIGISLKATDPRTAQAALQTLMEEYVGLGVEQNEKLGRQAYALVERNLEQASSDLEKVREERRRFLVRNGASLGRPFEGTAQPMAGRSGDPSDIGTVTAGSSVVGTLRARLAQMEIRLMELRQVYTDDSENVKTLQAGIAALNGRIDAEVKATADSEKGIDVLDLDVRSAEQRYLDLRRKLEQIDLFLKLNPAQALNRPIAESPVLPRSSEWKRSLLICILGSFAGLLLGIGVAGYREYGDHRMNSAEGLTVHLGLTALAVVEAMEDREVRAVLEAAGACGARRNA